ncbi:MAG: hypothetical protein KDD53_09860, partial [Bdellovibrionales bacterium]|nr:hypothetical protein [Bdellovibrionales bacterium]
MKGRRIKIFDTTLRDGQQCPGAGMSFDQNIEYARLASSIGIDIVEVGFPAASKLEYDIVQTIASELGGQKDAAIVAALCQLREDQVDLTIESLLPAAPFGKARLHTYLPVDPELMEASLGEKARLKEEIVEDLGRFVERAVKAGLEVEFSPEGYSRMGENFDFVTDLIRAAVQSGATTINCPDTIGGACKLQGRGYFVEKLNQHAEIIAREFPGKEIVWSAHCHNDFGLAVANTINAIIDGPVRQIEGCINGIGERAGNAALEQCIMIIKHFAPYENQEEPFYTNVKTEKLQEISNFVGRHMLARQPHWPVTGDNAAKHSSGGHTNAILNNPMAYQAFDPNEVGKKVSMVFGPLSGGNHAQSIIEEAGYVCEEHEKTEIAHFIKELFKERRKGITDEELIRGYFQFRAPMNVESFDYSRSSNTSSIHLQGKFFDQTGSIEESYQGKESALAALKRAIDGKIEGLEIENYSSESVGRG